HTSMYKKKPIYWLFCSNPQKPEKSAFKVLVYMHRMDKYTIQKIQRSYLHAHQEHIKEEIGNLVATESTLNKAELRRLEMLRNWEIECRDYNETLKALAVQQIEFDLDDGVDTNYAKFAGAVAKI
nr:BREX-1 system adenine-specific DNA-methyltransferase PglX [Spirosomataceae bacterium]